MIVARMTDGLKPVITMYISNARIVTTVAPRFESRKSRAREWKISATKSTFDPETAKI